MFRCNFPYPSSLFLAIHIVARSKGRLRVLNLDCPNPFCSNISNQPPLFFLFPFLVVG